MVADFGLALRVPIHAAAEMARQHLRAETDAQERLPLFQRDADPVDFAAHEVVLVIGAHRAAEDDCAGVVVRSCRQRRRRKRGRRTSSRCRLPQGLPTRPGVECSWCRTIRIGCSMAKQIERALGKFLSCPPTISKFRRVPRVPHTAADDRQKDCVRRQAREKPSGDPVAGPGNYHTLAAREAAVADLGHPPAPAATKSSSPPIPPVRSPARV